MKSCMICEAKHYAKGYCNRHWKQIQRHGKITNSEPVNSNSIICKECGVDNPIANGLCRRCYMEDYRQPWFEYIHSNKNNPYIHTNYYYAMKRIREHNKFMKQF